MYNPYFYQQNNNQGVIWVQGLEGAKSYLVAPNNTVLLMDSEGSKFYLKSADMAGMPTLREFSYTENAQNASNSHVSIPNTEILTKEDINALMGQIEGLKGQIDDISNALAKEKRVKKDE